MTQTNKQCFREEWTKMEACLDSLNLKFGY